MRTLIIIVSVPLCMYLGGLTVILVVVIASEIRNYLFTMQNSPANVQYPYDYFFIQTWSLFQNILLQCCTFFLLLEFLMKKLNPCLILSDNSIYNTRQISIKYPHTTISVFTCTLIT